MTTLTGNCDIKTPNNYNTISVLNLIDGITNINTKHSKLCNEQPGGVAHY